LASFNEFVEVQGQVDAEQNVLALQQMPGMVTAIYVKEGQRVSKGQVLYVTDASTYEKQIAIVETQLSLATTAYEKQERLWAQNIGSEIQVLQAKANKEALEKQIATLRSTIELSKCKSPINGTVDEVRVKLGDMAAPSQLMPGVRVVNASGLVVRAKLAEAQIGKVKSGDRVEIEFPDLHKSISSRITYVGQVIDKQTRTFNIEAKLDNNSANYKANMIAKLKINGLNVNNVIVVPTNVIQHGENETYVLVAENKTAVKKDITVGDSYNGKSIVTSGLKTGDAIITFGFSEVVAGQKIEF
jgi:RND family efflux transporter MFP subunit